MLICIPASGSATANLLRGRYSVAGTPHACLLDPTNPVLIILAITPLHCLSFASSLLPKPDACPDIWSNKTS
jgi:hypothetical protein